MPAGGVSGAAAVGPLLPDLRRLPAAGGEGVAVVRAQVQPPGGADAGQPEQRLHPRLPAVPGLCPPGGAHGPWDFLSRTTAFDDQTLNTDFDSIEKLRNIHLLLLNSARQ